VAKLLLGSKKLGGCKNGTHLLYYHAKYGGDRGSRAGCRRKSVMFFVCLFVCLSRFGITKVVITETLWTSEIFKTVMVPLHRGRFLVVYLYSSFSMDPLGFFLGANLYQKLLFWAILAAVRPHFKATKVKVSTIAGTWESLPHAKFCKNVKGDIPFWSKYIPEITNFCYFGGCKPTFLKPQR